MAERFRIENPALKFPVDKSASQLNAKQRHLRSPLSSVAYPETFRLKVFHIKDNASDSLKERAPDRVKRIFSDLKNFTN